MNNIDKIIIHHILEAQKYSDAAKRAESYTSAQAIYKLKDRHLVEAVRSLEGARNSRISWKIEHKPDQNGHPSIIVYFEFKIQGKQIQFSFHNFNWKAFPVKKGKSSIQWNGVIGGCREAYRLIKSARK